MMHRKGHFHRGTLPEGPYTMGEIRHHSEKKVKQALGFSIVRVNNELISFFVE